MRLIDADALKFGLEKVTLYVQGLRFGKTVLGKILEAYRRAVYEEIENAHTIDPEELRPKGEWILKDGNGNGVCSHCNRQDKIDPLATHCRYCGAKMRGV